MRNTILAGLLLLPVVSHAAVYQLENPVYPVGVDYTFSGDPAQLFGSVPFTLEIADAAVASGHFAYSYDPSLGGTFGGDVASLVSFTTPAERQSPLETLRINLRFDAAGDVLSGSSLVFVGDRSELRMKGDAQNFNGTFVLGPSSGFIGTISGQLLDPIDVPEPSSAELFFVALGSWAATVLVRIGYTAYSRSAP